MYTNIFYERDKNILHVWDDNIGYTKHRYSKYAYIKDRTGSLISIFGDHVKKITSGFNNYEPHELFESDVRPEVRYLVDHYTDDDSPSEQNILFFDIEVEVKELGFPDINKGANKVTSVAAYTSKGQVYTVFILDPDYQLPDEFRTESLDIHRYDSEQELLLHVIEYFSSSGATIVTGWNSEGFDIPYLTKRIEVVLGTEYVKKMSPIGVAEYYEGGYAAAWSFAGFSHLDLLALYKKFTYSEKSSYKLDDVAEDELGIKKIKYKGTLDELYETDRKKFIQYNVRDVQILVKLENKLKFIEVAVNLSHIGHIPYDSILSQMRLIDGAILTFMKRNNIVAPSRKESEQQTFPGAHVKDPYKGLHEWIYDLDFSSMYPSIVISLNISPESKIGKIPNWNINASDDSMFEIEGTPATKEHIKQFCAENNLCISAAGVIYDMNKKGVIPIVLKEWLDTRNDHKNLMKKFGKEGNADLEKRYNISQMAFKILANSLYGIMGNKHWRFFDIDNAMSVTLTGQEEIKFAEKVANEYYNTELDTKEDYCIYIDTDSLFFSAKPLMEHMFPDQWESDPVRYTKNITSVIQEYVNKKMSVFVSEYLFINTNLNKHRFSLKQEVIAKSGLFVTKKKYGLYIIDRESVPKDELDVKGLDIVRSNYPKLFQNFLSDLLKKILSKEDKKTIDKFVIQFKNDVKNADLINVATPTGVKGLHKYNCKPPGFIKGTPVHVKASLNYNRWVDANNFGKKYQRIENNSKIQWIYVKEKLTGFSEIAFPQGECPDELYELIHDKINFKRLFSSSVDSKVKMFYEPMGWGILVDERNTLSRFME